MRKLMRELVELTARDWGNRNYLICQKNAGLERFER